MDALSSIRSLLGPAGKPGITYGAVADAANQAAIPLDAIKTFDAVAPASNASAWAPPGASFGDLLGSLIQGVNEKRVDAADAVSGLVSGENVPLHQAVVAMEESSISFHLMVEVRNRLLEAYQELMRMQI